MLLYEMKAPNSFFGPPFPPRRAFDKLFNTMGPYQGLFYQNKRLILQSPALRGIWPEAEHGRSWEDFLSHFPKMISPGEKTHLEEFRKAIASLDKPYSDRFVLASNSLRDFTFLVIHIHPTPFGFHLVLVPASERSNVESIHQSLARQDHHPLFRELGNWIHEMESEELMSEAIRSVPDLYRNDVFFQRIVSYLSADGTEEQARLIYRERNERWVRDIFDENQDPHTEEKAPRIHAKIENGDIQMNITLFVGQVHPLSWAAILYQTLGKKSLSRFYEFVRNFSDKSAYLAQDFVSPIFDYSKFWIGQGYRMESLQKIADMLSPSPLTLPVIPIWGLTSDTLSIIRQTARLSDPVFLDWEKGLAAILLRNCSLEAAEKTVFGNLSKRMQLPLEPPVTVGNFLENN